MTVGVLVLAAGNAARFGSDKRFALMANNKSVLDNTLANIIAAKLAVLVCLKTDDLALQAKLTKQEINWCISTNAHKGMGLSIATGISHCHQWESTIIALADMPKVTKETYNLIAQCANKEKIIIPTYENNSGNPVCFGRQFYNKLKALNEDKGAKSVVLDNNNSVLKIEVPDQGIFADIDTPNDLTDFNN